MGAWGVNTFDNDMAGDWGVELAEASDLEFVEATIDRALEAGEDYLDSDDAATGLAACEVVARLRGRWGVRDEATEAVDRWVEAHPGEPPAGLVAKAVALIDRVQGPDSELVDLWRESDHFAEWQAAMSDLRARVRG